MTLARIIAMLRQTIGLDVESVGLGLIEHAVKQRLKANHLQDVSQYADLLQRSGPELENLIEAVVIPETFFFRYSEAFAAFRAIVGKKFLIGSRKMRVLSVPCSTGEEPYSIAMSLLDEGLRAERFQIDAIDISARLLEIARLGQFGNNSFRAAELKFRDQYFRKTGGVFRLCDRVRECVRFEKGNILQGRFRFGSEPYDFIFCRNLLIYFDSPAQGQALESLRRLLTADGFLFAGPVESTLLAQHGFVSLKWPMAFAFQKKEGVTFPAPPKHEQRKVWSPAKAQQNDWGRLARQRGGGDRKPPPAIPRKSAPETAKHKWVPDLDFAEQLADRGRLGEAAEICEASLRVQGPSARAFHLLGLIRDGAGDQNRADDCYRKALYLEPDHYGALLHLALLKDKNGESTAAKALKDRARRVRERMK